MARPDFIIGGAPKCGTTFLYNLLKKSPDIGMSEVKEPKFFNYCDGVPAPSPSCTGGYSEWDKAIKTIGEYRDLFPESKGKIINGESSATYLYSADAAASIKRYAPDVKLIFLVRNPQKRAWSHYWFNRRFEFENLSFEEALDREEERIRQGRNPLFHYYHQGLYFECIDRYDQLFGRNQIKVVVFEDLVANTASVTEEIMEFLELEPRLLTSTITNKGFQKKSKFLDGILNNPSEGLRTLVRGVLPAQIRKRIYSSLSRANKAPVPKIFEEVERHLAEKYLVPNQALEERLGRSLSIWN